MLRYVLRGQDFSDYSVQVRFQISQKNRRVNMDHLQGFVHYISRTNRVFFFSD